MTRRKIAYVASSAAAALLLLALAAILVLRSNWFDRLVRTRVVDTIETATGGRAEIGSFQFDWKTLRVSVRQFTLRGTEPEGKPPLFRADSVELGLKIVSLLRRDVNLEYLNVTGPRIYLIVAPDGRTNIPEPKSKLRGERSPIETLLNLAVGRFNLRNGVFEVEARSRIPFSLRGRNLDAAFGYERAVPRYRGDVSVQSLDLRWDGQTAVPAGVRMAVALEQNRIAISSARLSSGASAVDFAGSVKDLASPRADFQYQAHLAAADVIRVFPLRGLESGRAEIAGTARWAGGSNYSLTGNLHASGVNFRQAPLQVRNGRIEGALALDSQGARLSGIQFSGDAPGARGAISAKGRVAAIDWRGNTLDFRGIGLDALGGSFTGNARLEGYEHFHVSGDLRDLDTRTAVAFYSPEPLPWDSRLSGSVSLDGSLRRRQDLRASADLALSPAGQGAPVHGRIAASYDASIGALDLGQSTLDLPASRIELSGSIGHRLQVHLETRDLNDFLPALGESTKALPVILQNGSVVFEGEVTGQLEDPHVSGRLTATGFTYDGRSFDRLEAGLTATPESLELRNAALTRGTLRAEFHLAAGLLNWKPQDVASLSGGGTLRNAAVADLLALAGRPDVRADGILNATAQVSGTVGNPQANAEVEVTKGSFQGEPFERLTASLAGTAREVRLMSGQVTAGAKQVRFDASFQHPPQRLDTGLLQFQVQSNALPLDQIHTLDEARPGVRGTLQIAAKGAVNVSSGNAGGAALRVAGLQADVMARNLQLTGQPLGDAHLTANSEGGILRTHLESTLANSAVRGDGEWRLEQEYPGSATITFSRLDLAALRAWIAPSRSGLPSRIGGFAEGELRLNGPALQPDRMRAELRIPALEVRANPDLHGFVLRNSGPVTASIAKSVISIEHATLTGPSTDLAVTGKVSLAQKEPFDLRVNGTVDLAVLRSFDSRVTSSGRAITAAAIRGELAEPQVNGRLELQNAAFSYGDLPNGLTNGSGVILFSGEQATIQSFKGETGGGTIQLSGFAGYAGNSTIIRLHADGKNVRVRYPAGVSTVTDSSLNLAGTADRTLLSGAVTIRRASVNLQSDFSSLLSKSAEPVRTPAAQAGFLGGMNFDVQIQTAPDAQIESALTEGIQADANLRLRGTAASPGLLGRINITRGQVTFFGAKYSISQGSISFLNLAKIDPILNIDLETRARGIDITLEVSGPLNQLQLTPRSDPPLQFNEIVAVLTTGENPTSESMRLGEQATSANPTQQATGSALLGQVLSSPVSGRLQRFFGISKLRVDPTLAGVEYNPLARIILEQQVSPDVTFTYITYITSANPQVVSVEWALSKQWSAYASRLENGEFGLQFFYKRQFK